MADNPPAVVVAAPADVGPSKEKLGRILKAFNVINALFIGATGVVTFIITPPPVSVPVALSACYLIVFSLLLLCFECNFEFLNLMIVRNFGFMFNWGGRLIFLLLTGTLAFGLGAMGIAAGCFTAAVIIINMYILCRYREFGEAYEDEYREMRLKAFLSEKPKAARETPLQAVVVSSGGAAASVAYQPSSGGSAYSGTAPPSSRSEMTEANGWKKHLDDKSGKYYFYNDRTKETRWDTEDP
jgi:hypothetical protein